MKLKEISYSDQQTFSTKELYNTDKK